MELSSNNVVVVCDVFYPKPPTRIPVTYTKDTTFRALKQNVAQITKFDETKFILVTPGSTEEPNQDVTVSELSKGASKLVLNLKRGTDAQYEFIDHTTQKKIEPASSNPTTSNKKSQACSICLEEVPVETLGNSLCCKSCIADYLHAEFFVKRKSFLEIKYPSGGGSFTLDEFRQYARPDTLERFEIIMQTIPENPKDPNLTIQDFGYDFNEQGLLRHVKTGEKFHWVNQVHYDLLGDLIIPYIQKRMVSDFGMQEVLLPVTEKERKGIPEHCRNNIFITKDVYENKNKLMLLIQGSGAVRAGQWARALCINDSLETGSIFNYLQRAIQAGYSVVVFNPNLNYATKEPLVRPDRSDFFKPGKPVIPDPPRMKIPGSETPPDHTVYVWDHIASKSPAKEIVIVAHSAGGWCTLSLLNSRKKEVLPRLKAIAFTDAVSSVTPRDAAQVRDFLKNNCINWVQSRDPLDTPQPNVGGCICVSSGHEKHEYTSASAINSVFKFLEAKTTQVASQTNNNN